ncbi:unnamed protein product [Lathyrus oleraceus]
MPQVEDRLLNNVQILTWLFFLKFKLRCLMPLCSGWSYRRIVLVVGWEKKQACLAIWELHVQEVERTYS